MWKYGFIFKGQLVITLADDKKKLVRNFLSHLVGDSHQVRTIITVERLRVFYFNANIALQVDMIQFVASKGALAR